MEEIKIFAPASVANVSCGFDVLGFCLEPIGDEMIIRKINTPGLKISKIVGQKLPLEIKKNVAGVAAKAILTAYPSKFGFDISTTWTKISDSLTSSSVDLNDSTN